MTFTHRLIIRAVSFAVICLMISSAHAQDKVLLMNGQEFDCVLLSDTGTVLVFQLTKKNGKVKTKERHKNDVFSYTPQGKSEVVLYAKDEMLGDLYTVDEMRIYMAGEVDARENFTAYPTMVGGIIFCGVLGYLGGDGVLTSTIPPVIYMCLQLIPRIKIRESTMSNTGYKYNDVYADGYEPPARSKKILSALTGGYIGAAAGVGLWFIAK